MLTSAQGKSLRVWPQSGPPSRPTGPSRAGPDPLPPVSSEQPGRPGKTSFLSVVCGTRRSADTSTREARDSAAAPAPHPLPGKQGKITPTAFALPSADLTLLRFQTR